MPLTSPSTKGGFVIVVVVVVAAVVAVIIVVVGTATLVVRIAIAAAAAVIIFVAVVVVAAAAAVVAIVVVVAYDVAISAIRQSGISNVTNDGKLYEHEAFCFSLFLSETSATPPDIRRSPVGPSYASYAPK